MGILPSIGIDPLTSRRSFVKTSTMATLPDFIAIARDIVQESCLRIPLTEPERISQCHCIFVSAGLVKEMCDDPDYEEDLQEDIAKLILYCALVVEHTADFLAKHDPNTRISVSRYVLVAPRPFHYLGNLTRAFLGFRTKRNI